ncbi:hypothetical protein MSAN_01345300 [Mycena sanguinolenta]|uniref:Uncharacterized protein n=1 Tax=Mycena sanguinolenta TaxID=230812 RepID=A0A8H7D3C9_9AGAR|nr:hypothetical protein MSAN_01345300 [Mycena sanguinolenta]
MQSPGPKPQFQQTSAESFEASLMAGGYGVYKTSEWVRQPQFSGDFPAPPPGPSKAPIFKPVEAPAPLTEKQRRKKWRLDKFRNGGCGPPQRLFVGEVRGIGRVILDETPQNGVYTDATAAAAARRPAEERRRKKAAADFAARERERKEREMTFDDLPTQPNWPDDDFPWRLQEERRVMLQKQDRELRMRYIEDFFAQDTEDEELEDAVERSHLEREAAARDV